jgi:beta-N-acetylhexosaminidase
MIGYPIRGVVMMLAASVALTLPAFSQRAAKIPTTAKSGAGAKASGSKSSTSGTPALLRSLSLHDRIAQLFVVRGYGDYPPSDDTEYERFIRWIRQDHVGGFIIAGHIRDGNVIPAQPFELAAFVNHMQRVSKLPLLVASDFERGASMRVAETARFPYMMAFGAAHDLSATRELGAATAREARAMGVNWVFAPDADVNNNPDNPIINTRSFGEDPQAVAQNVGAFIDGAHSAAADYVLVTAKHFPGHGDTAEDSHMQLAQLNQTKERIESLELVPFRAAIEHGVDSVMTAHMSVPAFEPAAIPATVSSHILTGLLRDELGFKGLIVTDALEMQGISSLYTQGEAAVRAIEAGADVLLMPTDPGACIRAIEAAVKSRRLSTARINASAARVIMAKQRLGLMRKRTVDLEALSNQIKEPRLDALADLVAEKAFTLVKDDKHLFPMPQANGSCLIVMTDGQFSRRGETIFHELNTYPLNAAADQVKVYLTNSAMPAELLNAIAAQTAQCKQIYVAAFVTVAANRGDVALQGGLAPFLNTLTDGPAPVALISLGNPYLLRTFPKVAAYAATFSSAESSELATARAMLGEIAITGRLPVSIPGFAKMGDGLDVSAKSAAASKSTAASNIAR